MQWSDHLMNDTSREHHPVTVYRPAFWSAMPANSMPNRGGRPTIRLMSQPATAPVTYNMNMEDRLPPGTAISSGETFTYSSDQARATPTIAAAALAAAAGSRSSHHAMATTSPAVQSSSPAPSLSCSCSGCSSGGSVDPALSTISRRMYIIYIYIRCTCPARCVPADKSIIPVRGRTYIRYYNIVISVFSSLFENNRTMTTSRIIIR